MPSETLGDLTDCTPLSASAKPGATQKNPLMDNYEGMAITNTADGHVHLSIISDNNFRATQTTRILNLSVNTRDYSSDAGQPDPVALLSDFTSLWNPSSSFDPADASTFGTGVVSNPSVLKHNDDMTQAINHAAAQAGKDGAPSAQVQRALVDSGHRLEETLPDSLGPVLGGYLQEGLSNDELPLFGTLFTQTNNTGYGVSTLGDYLSTSAAKRAFNHPRPYVDRHRAGYPAAGLVSSVDIIRAPVWTDAKGMTHDPSYGDMTLSGSFPSGHTTYAMSGAVGLATLLPELAPEILARGSEAGNNRIVLGVHYPLDIIGGRIDGEAANVARWSDADFVKDQLQPARQELVDYLTGRCRTNGYGSSLDACIRNTDANGAHGYVNAFVDAVSTEPITDRGSAIMAFRKRMTYGFGPSTPRANAERQTASDHNVPSGAENLLLTAYPTLSPAQRREVLAQTALPISGNPLEATSQGYYDMDLASALSAAVELDGDGHVVKVTSGQPKPSVVQVDTNHDHGSAAPQHSDSADAAKEPAHDAPHDAPQDDGSRRTATRADSTRPLAETGSDLSLLYVLAPLTGAVAILLLLAKRSRALRR